MAPFLYKYLKHEHAVALLKRGIVQVGTLYGYREIESLKVEIGDASEGYSTVHSDDPLVDWKNPDTINPVVERLFKIPPGSQGIMTGAHLTLIQQSEDVYAYCFSAVADRDAMRRMGYNACVAVLDPLGFLSVLTAHLTHHGIATEPVIVHSCKYFGRLHKHQRPGNIHPAFIKDPRHSYQREVRALWRAAGDGPTARLVEVPELATLCAWHECDGPRLDA
jgi:hypothetical protein